MITTNDLRNGLLCVLAFGIVACASMQNASSRQAANGDEAIPARATPGML